jgi:hypothetical protein
MRYPPSAYKHLSSKSSRTARKRQAICLHKGCQLRGFLPKKANLGILLKNVLGIFRPIKGLPSYFFKIWVGNPVFTVPVYFSMKSSGKLMKRRNTIFNIFNKENKILKFNILYRMIRKSPVIQWNRQNTILFHETFLLSLLFAMG